MATAFVFVRDNGGGTCESRESKKLIRRHVMKGKNAGKKIHRPSRLTQLATRRASDTPASMFCDLGFPVETTPERREIIYSFFTSVADRLYPCHLGITMDDAKRLYFEILFQDQDTSNEFFLREGKSSPKALRYLSQTLTLVRKRVEGPDALSDSTLMIVLSLVSQEQMRGEYVGAKVHAEGLRKMVQLRGGLDGLEGNEGILLKVCKIDIVAALQHGGPTMFYLDRMSKVRDVATAKGLKFDRPSSLSFGDRHGSVDPHLEDVFLDVLAASRMLNGSLPGRTLDILTFLHLQISIFYRLLRYCPLAAENQRSDVDSTCHIGLIVFMMTVLLQHEGRSILDYRLVKRHLRGVLSSQLGDTRDTGMGLWAMCMGGIWMAGTVDLDWLFSRIWLSGERLSIQTWDDARRLLVNFPWINIVHDQPGRQLWEDAHRRAAESWMHT
ncbi:hypothetical protein MKZ38_005255 [Zalerion maritima]|uniref:Uncharacterized protein n=1 Tax=Zalerion maritima TaxID=339359 RepID=A0AAD5RLJ5_9PEZI|nr:hypothetical protein MKZ38_005255 [Zalerion maritima]